ncbi:hypothetical protein HII36_47060 [Nonomuraea sp. NN258]|uniref:hypothetical protein n=1 Tax=Nonomuraea antri TaxID=2730852 RepID=UPI00156A45E9|nr:hypothetical protein [Nonomuraea antri]NRQ39334.1 hypothetical protein [Nonomuraea antri]
MASVAAGARRWLRGDIVLAAGLAMVAAQCVWKFELVRRTYFRQDDFMFIVRGLENQLTWDYLMRIDGGHMAPGPFALQWVIGRLGAYNDQLAHLFTIALLLAAGLALLRLLRLLFGSRPAILVPLGFYLLTPMTIPSLSWWAVVLGAMPFQIALPMALSSHVLYTRTKRLRHAVAAAAWTLFAMAFFLKAPFILVLAFVLTLGWLDRRGTLRVWLLYFAVLAGYTALFLVQLLTSQHYANETVKLSVPGPEAVGRFGWQLLSNALVPTSLGGPWRWTPIGDDYAIAAPPAASVWAGLGVAVLVIAVSVWLRRRAWLAWLLLFGYFGLADIVPIMIARLEQLGPELAGLELRYISSTSMVAAVAIGLAFIPVKGEQEPWLRSARGLRWAWVPLAAAFTAGSVWSVAAYGQLPLGRNVKSYVETARLALALAPKDAVVLDTYVPEKVAIPYFFGDYALNSKVLGPVAPPGITWTRRLSGQVRDPLILDAQGRLRPLVVDGVSIPPRGDCTQVGGQEVRLPLPRPIEDGEWTVQVSYLNQAPTTLSVRVGLARSDVPAGDGLGTSFGRFRGGGAEVTVRTLDGRGACVGEIRIGTPVPAEGGTPSPLRPVEP